MKKAILTAACAMAAVGAFAQGTVTFVNNNDIFAPASAGGGDLGPGTGGTYMAELVVGGSEIAASATPVNAGFFYGPIVTIPGLTPGANVTYQVEVWDTSFGATFAAASVAQNAIWGETAAFTEPSNPALPAPPLGGLNFPALTTTQNVPEPTTMALGALGAASLFLIRRRK